MVRTRPWSAVPPLVLSTLRMCTSLAVSFVQLESGGGDTYKYVSGEGSGDVEEVLDGGDKDTVTLPLVIAITAFICFLIVTCCAFCCFCGVYKRMRNCQFLARFCPNNQDVSDPQPQLLEPSPPTPSQS